ncbi:MAG: 50S ribosomal protein L13 [bacterium]
MKKRKTKFIDKSKVVRQWFLADASEWVLGRLASQAAVYLRGKHKPIYTPQTDCGDYIVVVNAEKIKFTGAKAKAKTYFTHSGYPGGDKLLTLEKMLEKKPEKVIQLAIGGMLPHGRLGAKMIKKLKVYRGERKEFNKLPKLEGAK